MTERHRISSSRVIAAEPQAIFDVLADPSLHPVIDGSGSVCGSRGDGPERLSLHARFGMDMRLGSPYRITNTVVEFEEGRVLAWRHFHGHRWRYELEQVPDGTRVTETFDWSRARSKLTIRLLRWPQRNLRNMEATLERLERFVLTGERPERVGC